MNLNVKNKKIFITQAEKLIDKISMSMELTDHFLCVDLFGSLSEKDCTIEEELTILAWFKKQRPTKKMNKSFYTDESITYSSVGAWWNNSLRGNEQRMLFLNHLIKKLS